VAESDHAAPAPDLPPLREVIRRHGLSARKSLGQHFLLDSNLTHRIARAAGDLTDSDVIEVGPGPGGLTRALLAVGARKVFAVERDVRCIAALRELADAYPGRLEIIAGDALEIDGSTLGARPRRIVANLPYNIATVLLIAWLRRADAFDGFTLMFQKEVAERIAAKPRTKAYGRLAVMAQWLCVVKLEFNLDRRAFTPPPKVSSSVVTLMPRPEPLAPATWRDMETVTAAAFNQRRKMLRASLRAFDFDFAALGIAPEARAEELPVEQFCALARAAGERTG
jgi:16S rRNA (adenine1518-N6/adenine1519-N6)-dimethyltransferase